MPGAPDTTFRPEGGARFRSVDRVDSPSRAEFASRWLAHNEPVVVTQCADEWLAPQRWSFDDLRARFGDRTVEVACTDAVGHLAYTPRDGVRREMILLRDHLDDVEAGRGGHYLLAPVHERLPELLKGVRMPPFVPEPSWRHSRFWLGPAGTISPLHHDLPDNLLVQLVGRKRVVLFPRRDTWRMYAHAPWSKVPNYSRVDALAPDLESYPRFADATRYECTIAPGEMLFIPKLWWHQVVALDVSISFNLWWARGLHRAIVELAQFAQVLRGLRW